MTKAKQVIRILVADDHAIFREGLRKLLDAAEEIRAELGGVQRPDNAGQSATLTSTLGERPGVARRSCGRLRRG